MDGRLCNREADYRPDGELYRCRRLKSHGGPCAMEAVSDPKLSVNPSFLPAASDPSGTEVAFFTLMMGVAIGLGVAYILLQIIR